MTTAEQAGLIEELLAELGWSYEEAVESIYGDAASDRSLNELNASEAGDLISTLSDRKWRMEAANDS